MKIILASTSKYRRAQLQGLGLDITPVAPPADEEEIRIDTLGPREVAEQRAELKTLSVAETHFDDIVIGGDQVVELEGHILCKPLSEEAAREQLQFMAGKTHQLISSAVISYREQIYRLTTVTRLKMHTLSAQQIHSYVQRDQPLDCAGSYKIEEHGLWLFESIHTEDFTAIQGLPLLGVVDILRELGASPLESV